MSVSVVFETHSITVDNERGRRAGCPELEVVAGMQRSECRRYQRREKNSVTAVGQVRGRMPL